MGIDPGSEESGYCTIDEDYYIPVRAGSSSDITSLQGQSNAMNVDDINYLKENLYAAIKIPKSYLTRGEGGDAKTNLSQLDVRFARTILRLQRAIIAELEKIAMIHLYTLGYRGEDILSFTLELNNPSKIAQMQELEYWKSKFAVAADAKNGGFSGRWVSKNILNLTEEEFVRNQYDKFYDKRLESALAQEAGGAEGETPMPSGGGDLSGMGGLGETGAAETAPPAPETPAGPTPEGTPAAGETAAPAPEAPAAPKAEESPLLVEPAGRRGYDWVSNVQPDARVVDKYGRTLTPNSKGKWYTPVATDGREDSGPRHKNMMSNSGKIETSSRSTLPGLHDMKRTAIGISESKENIYALLEERMRRINKEADLLSDKVNSDDKE